MRELARSFAYSTFGGFSRLLAETVFLLIITAWGTAQAIVDIKRLLKKGKKYLKYMYGSDDTTSGINSAKHRSLYKGYYDIEIYKIYFDGKSEKELKRVKESRIFHGVPTFNLTEKVSDKISDFEIKWHIIGLEKTEIVHEHIDYYSTDSNFDEYGKWEKTDNRLSLNTLPTSRLANTELLA